MAIKMRRGADADFRPDKMLPGELAVTVDGTRKVYAAFAAGDVKELSSKEDVDKTIASGLQSLETSTSTKLQSLEKKAADSIGRIDSENIKIQEELSRYDYYPRAQIDLEYSHAPRGEATGKGSIDLSDSDRGKAYVELEGASEQYTDATTPSPEKPSEVKSVGDIPKDVNGVEIRNLLDEEWIRSQPESAWRKIVNQSGTLFTIDTVHFEFRKYRVEGFVVQTVSNDIKYNMAFSNDVVGFAPIYINAKNGASITYDLTGQSVKPYFAITILNDSNGRFEDAMKAFDYFKIMLTTAAEIDEYRPYIGANKGLVKLKSQGKNLADMEYMTSTYPSLITKVDGRYKISMPTTDKPKFNIDEIKQDATYCIRAKIQNERTGLWASGLYVFYTDGMNEPLIIHGHGNLNEDLITRIYTKPSGKTIDSFGFGVTNSGIPAYFSDVQIEISDKVTEYQPYHQQITWVTLKEPLRAIGEYKDTVDREGNVVQRIEKKHGTEAAYSPGAERDETELYRFPCNIEPNRVAVFSNIFKSNIGIWGADFECAAGSDLATSRYYQVRVLKSRLVGKTINIVLKDLGFLVFFVLENPTTYQIPAIHIETYDPITHARCLNKVTPNMKLDYKKSLTKILSDLQNAVLALGGK